MSESGFRSLLTPQRLFIVIGLLIVLSLSAAFYITATDYEAHTPQYHGEARPPTPTTGPPHGRRWFFMRPFWLSEPAPQP